MNMTKKMKRAKFWQRTMNEDKEVWHLIVSDDPSNVPSAVWRTYNRKFWEAKSLNLLYPADTFDAYQAGIEAILKISAEIDAGTRTLRNCSRTTYLVAAGCKRLLQFRRQVVAPMRDAYRQLFDCGRVADLDELDDETPETPPKLDVRLFVESLPALNGSDVNCRREWAKLCVHETLARCSDETADALHVLLACNCNVSAAAKTLGMSRGAFRRRCTNVWFPEFRRLCSWH